MSVGFKEWALVCEALARGDQSLIIRKGGIAEGKAGFTFEHPEFFLFPTFFHEQVARLKIPAETALPQPTPGEISVQLMARCIHSELVTDPSKVKALEPFHIWKPEIIEERFHYQGKGAQKESGVHLAILRVYRLSRPWIFPDAPAYGGCRSWIELPGLPGEFEMSPVLTNAMHQERVGKITQILKA